MPTLTTVPLKGGSGFETTTQGLPAAYTGPSGAQDVLNEILRFKLDQMRRAAAPPSTSSGAFGRKTTIGSKTPMPAGRRSGGLGSGEETAAAKLARRQQEVALEDLESQLQAKRMAPPLRMVTGPGVVMGWTPDVDRMSGYQREAFLPDQAVERG